MLTHYQMTNFRLFQIERVCRRQFQIGRKLPKQEENTVGKGEIAYYEQFLLFPQRFQDVFPVCPFPFRPFPFCPLPSRPLPILPFTILLRCHLAQLSFCPLTISPFCQFTRCLFAQCYLAPLSFCPFTTSPNAILPIYHFITLFQFH